MENNIDLKVFIHEGIVYFLYRTRVLYTLYSKKSNILDFGGKPIRVIKSDLDLNLDIVSHNETILRVKRLTKFKYSHIVSI